MTLLFYSIFRGAPRRVYENETLSARAERETGRLYYRLDGGHHRRHRRDQSITPPHRPSRPCAAAVKNSFGLPFDGLVSPSIQRL